MKIISLCPNPSDGVSWYRCAGPLNRMLKDYPDFEYLEWGTGNLSWDILQKADVIFINRPYREDQLIAINQAITIGCKVWIDWDDLLWELPEHHKLYRHYMRQDKWDEMINLLKQLNPEHVAISVSTNYLAKKIREHNTAVSIYVIPNAFDERMFGTPRQFAGDATHAGWRGGDTHKYDLLEASDQILDFLKVHPAEFLGYNPEFITFRSGNAISTDGMGLLEYFKFIMEKKRWKVWFVPLEDNSFNRSKSNIAWLEATYAGAVTVAPAWEEWKRPGVITEYENLSEAVSRVMDMDLHDRYGLWKQSVDYIEENLLLSKTNLMRYNLLTDLLNIKHNERGKKVLPEHNQSIPERSEGEFVGTGNPGEDAIGSQ